MSEHQKLTGVPTDVKSDIDLLFRNQFPQTVDPITKQVRDDPTLMVLDRLSVMRQMQAWTNANLLVTYNLSVETEALMVALEQKIDNISATVEAKINKALWWFVALCSGGIITGIVAWSFK